MTAVDAPSGDDSEPGAHLGVIVVNYGSHDLLERNLTEIGTGSTTTTIVVVDNMSTTDERTRCRSLAARHDWLLEEPSTNLGFGSAVNRGVSRATGAGCDRFLLLNPDVAITAGAIDALVAVGDDHTDAILTPRLVRPDGSTWFAGGQIDLDVGSTRTRPDAGRTGPGQWLTGACLLVPKATWDALGGFDDRYFLYWEDIDLTQRQLRRGGELVIVDDITAVHSVGGTQRTEGKSPLYCYYNTRNRLLFASLHVPVRTRLRWLVRAPRYAWRTTLLSGRRIALRRPSLAWASIRGTLVGAALVVRSLWGQATTSGD